MSKRGLCALSCLVLGVNGAHAGQQFKFVDLAPPSSNSFVSGTRAVAICEVTSGGIESGVVDASDYYILSGNYDIEGEI